MAFFYLERQWVRQWVGGAVGKHFFKNYCYFLLNYLPTHLSLQCAQSLKRKIVKRKASLRETVTDLSTARKPYKGKLLLKRSATLYDIAFFFGKAVGRWGNIFLKIIVIFCWTTYPPTHHPTHISLHCTIPKKKKVSREKLLWRRLSLPYLLHSISIRESFLLSEAPPYTI